jgi:hypothetical protein
MVEQVNSNQGPRGSHRHDEATQERSYLSLSPKLAQFLGDAMKNAEQKWAGSDRKPAAYRHAIQYLMNIIGQPGDSERCNFKPGFKDAKELAKALEAIKGALLAEVNPRYWPAEEHGIRHRMNNVLRYAFQDLRLGNRDRIEFVEELLYASILRQDPQDWTATLTPPSDPAR